MGILYSLIWVILHLACVATDVAILLLLCRMVSMWCSIRWLDRVNDAAKGPVDSMNMAIGRLRHRINQKQLSCKAELLIGLLVLLLGRLVLCNVARLLWQTHWPAK